MNPPFRADITRAVGAIAEAVAKFVKQRLDFAKGHQRRLVAHRWRAIADEVGHRQTRLPRLPRQNV